MYMCNTLLSQASSCKTTVNYKVLLQVPPLEQTCFVSNPLQNLMHVKLKLFVRIRQQTIFSCVYEFIVTSGQLFPVHGELNNTVLK